MSTNLDLDDLLEAAGASEARDEVWFAAKDLKSGVGMEAEDARYVAAAKPEVVTALVWRVRELEALEARMQEWAATLDAAESPPGSPGAFLAAEIRRRLRGES